MIRRQGWRARALQTGRLLHSEGAAGVGARILQRGADALRPAAFGKLPVDREDLVRAAEIAAGGWRLPAPAPWAPGEPMRVGWVCVPPGEGSGGHTTLFRMAAELERLGHTSVIYLQDRHGWSVEQHRRTIRRAWPWLGAEIRDLADGIEDSHAVFASGWSTAYPVLGSPALGVRCYFVQDFEPSFYAAGSEAMLAAATYRFGFQGVTAGRWLARLLRRDYGMAADHFDFGCDVERYRFDPSAKAAAARTGVCCYYRPSTPRRANELALMALDLFAARCPDIEIHLFGEHARRTGIRATEHGVQTPEQLGALYGRCVAGLTLSATNVSLVPHEMLATGCIPVVNDAEQNRIVLDNPYVVYAPDAPFEIAATLERLVAQTNEERIATARAAAASVHGFSWSDAGAQVERIVRRAVLAGAAPTAAVGPRPTLRLI